MTSTDQNETQRKPFFKNLFHRRVPQIMGFYLGAVWGAIQFTEWVVNRYMFSPHLVDLAAIITISLIPTALIIAYFHGRPGRDKWVKTEIFGIPLNIILTVVLVLSFTGGKDLGSVSQKVTIQDETGKQTERMIPKTKFRKKVLVYYFKNNTGDASLDWLQYGLTHMLNVDLDQDLFFEIKTPYTEELDDIGFSIYKQIKKTTGKKDAVNLPLPLRKNVAQDAHMEYFLSGDFSKEGEGYVLGYQLHRTRNAKIAAKGSIKGADAFALIDALSLRLKDDLDIPKAHIEEVGDLPVAEIFTGSLKAARFYVLGQNAMAFDNDWSNAQKHIESSVREDPEFAFAYRFLGVIYQQNNRKEALAENQKKLMRLIYKFPERNQLFTKFLHYQTTSQVDKSMAILQMIRKLYPEEMTAQTLLARLLEATQKPDEAIRVYHHMLEIDPHRYEIFKKIGVLHQAKGDFPKALEYFGKYTARFPNKPDSFETMGGMYLEMGDHAKAGEQYQQVLLLEPGNIRVLTTLAKIEMDLGRFDAAAEKLEEALKTGPTAKEKGGIYDAQTDLYEMTGQLHKAFASNRLMFEIMPKYQVPLVTQFVEFLCMDIYAAVGKEKEAFQRLAAMKPGLISPMDRLINFAYTTLYLELENPVEAEKYLSILEGTDKKMLTGLDPLLTIYRARLLEMLGRHAEAAEKYESMIAKNPTKKSLLRSAARCYRNLEQYDKAEKYLKEALTAAPGHPHTHYQLGLLYLETNDNENAKKHLTTALDAWKNADGIFKPAQKAAERLEALAKK